LLRVPHVVLAVNKMDLVDYAEPVFAAIAEEFTAYASELGVPGWGPGGNPQENWCTAIPISALAGDNVVEPSVRMDWYGGPTVLEHLESVPVGTDPSLFPARLPVQYVIRPQTAEHPDYRGYAGRIAAGVLRVGDEVSVLPSGRTSQITGIDLLGRAVDTAWAPQSVTVLLADDVDVSRGDVIAPSDAAPAATRDIEATVCHLHERPLRPGDRVLLKHGTRTVGALVKGLPQKMGLTRRPSRQDRPDSLGVNDIGSMVLRTFEPLPLDPYARSRGTGAFLLIDPADGATLAAGMAADPQASLSR
ncbi:hypothetical protein ACFV9D_38620, partial [Streptomyces sp. NPDC059875]